MNKNVKKIIKGIVGLGVMGGTAYLAYKLGESNGESKERVRAMAEFDDDEDIELDEDDDDYRFYDNMDEPDDGCLAPDDRENGYKFKPAEPVSLYVGYDTKPTKRDVLKMLADGNLSKEQIAAFTDLTAQQVESIEAEFKTVSA